MNSSKTTWHVVLKLKIDTNRMLSIFCIGFWDMQWSKARRNNRSWTTDPSGSRAESYSLLLSRRILDKGQQVMWTMGVKKSLQAVRGNEDKKEGEGVRKLVRLTGSNLCWMSQRHELNPDYRGCIRAQTVTRFTSQSEYGETIKKSKERREALKREGLLYLFVWQRLDCEHQPWGTVPYCCFLH